MSRRLTSTDWQTCPGSALTVGLLPPEEAVDFEFAAARLHDRAVLRGAVAVQIFRVPLLAVPVGGCRRSGRLSAGPVTIALAVHSVLRGRDGFPHLRIVEDARGGDWCVEWGEQAPPGALRSAESRCFFGYASAGADAGCRVPAQGNGPATRAESRRSDRLRMADEARHVPGRDRG
ncbi:DUF6302 family protein [Streptomyces sp. NPDC021224]|uniref:DUF6302 family protein n=1 Tax=unclassified Streptomyces TaxID=2593676 RepID=UPI003796AFB6